MPAIEFEVEIVRVLRRRGTAERIGVSPSTLDRLVKAGLFPAPLKLTARARGWKIQDIDNWLAARDEREEAVHA